MFELFVDGTASGPVGSVTGCQALFNTTTSSVVGGGVTTRVQADGYQPCEITIGADAGATVWTWLKQEMGGTFTRHMIGIAQYFPVSGVRGTEINLDHAVITKFTLPPIDSTSTALFEASMELQSATQLVTTTPSPTFNGSLAPHRFLSSTLTDTVQNIRGTMPAEAISQPYSWSVAVTKASNGRGGFTLGIGTAHTTDLMFITPSTATNTITDLRAWQQLIVQGRAPAPRTASFTVTAPAIGGRTAQRLTINLTKVQLTSPLDPLANAAGDFGWGVHADVITLTVT